MMEEREKSKREEAAVKLAVAADVFLREDTLKFEAIEKEQKELLDAVADALRLAAENSKRLDALELRLGIVKPSKLPKEATLLEAISQ